MLCYRGCSTIIFSALSFGALFSITMYIEVAAVLLLQTFCLAAVSWVFIVSMVASYFHGILAFLCIWVFLLASKFLGVLDCYRRIKFLGVDGLLEENWGYGISSWLGFASNHV